MHARVCEESKLYKKRLYVKIVCFVVKGSILEGCRRTVTVQIQTIFIIWIVYTSVRCVLAVLILPVSKISGRLVLKNGWVDLLQLECARSVIK